jgi:hypothetical protein
MPRRTVFGWITVLTSLAFSGVPAEEAHAADAARLLVVLRASEQPNHIYVWGNKDQRVVVGRTFGEPSMGRDAVEMLRTRVDYLNDTFKKTITSFDRDTPLAAALTQAFAEQGSVIEITPTAAGGSLSPAWGAGDLDRRSSG